MESFAICNAIVTSVQAYLRGATMAEAQLAKPRPRIVERDGLVCAFRFAPLTELDGHVLEGGNLRGPLWLHLDRIYGQTRRWLEQHAPVSSDAREFLLRSDERVHREVLDEGIGLVLGDLHYDFDADPEGFGTLRVFLNENLVITTRLHPLRSPSVVRREMLRGFDPGSTLGWLEHFVTTLAGTFEDVVAKLSDEIDDAEDRILAGRYHVEAGLLGRRRRLLARLRRQLNADRSALSPIANLPLSFGDAEQREGLRQALEHLAAVAQDLDLVQERARLLQEEIAGRVGEATNKNLFVLSTVTTVLLPVTLITGIFGMNVTDLPFSSRAHGFWWVAVTIVLAILLALYMLHKRRVL